MKKLKKSIIAVFIFAIILSIAGQVEARVTATELYGQNPNNYLGAWTYNGKDVYCFQLGGPIHTGEDMETLEQAFQEAHRVSTNSSDFGYTRSGDIASWWEQNDTKDLSDWQAIAYVLAEGRSNWEKQNAIWALGGMNYNPNPTNPGLATPYDDVLDLNGSDPLGEILENREQGLTDYPDFVEVLDMLQESSSAENLESGYDKLYDIRDDYVKKSQSSRITDYEKKVYEYHIEITNLLIASLAYQDINNEVYKLGEIENEEMNKQRYEGIVSQIVENEGKVSEYSYFTKENVEDKYFTYDMYNNLVSKNYSTARNDFKWYLQNKEDVRLIDRDDRIEYGRRKVNFALNVVSLMKKLDNIEEFQKYWENYAKIYKELINSGRVTWLVSQGFDEEIDKIIEKSEKGELTKRDVIKIMEKADSLSQEYNSVQDNSAQVRSDDYGITMETYRMTSENLESLLGTIRERIANDYPQNKPYLGWNVWIWDKYYPGYIDLNEENPYFTKKISEIKEQEIMDNLQDVKFDGLHMYYYDRKDEWYQDNVVLHAICDIYDEKDMGNLLKNILNDNNIADNEEKLLLMENIYQMQNKFQNKIVEELEKTYQFNDVEVDSSTKSTLNGIIEQEKANCESLGIDPNRTDEGYKDTLNDEQKREFEKYKAYLEARDVLNGIDGDNINEEETQKRINDAIQRVAEAFEEEYGYDFNEGDTAGNIIDTAKQATDIESKTSEEVKQQVSASIEGAKSLVTSARTFEMYHSGLADNLDENGKMKTSIQEGTTEKPATIEKIENDGVYVGPYKVNFYQLKGENKVYTEFSCVNKMTASFDKGDSKSLGTRRNIY